MTNAIICCMGSLHDPNDKCIIDVDIKYQYTKLSQLSGCWRLI